MRGGLGQVIEMENGISEPLYFNCAFERVKFAARGVAGAMDGAAGYVGLKSGERLPSKGRHLIPVGDRVLIMSPGGGGIGDPSERDRAQVEADLGNGLISAQAAHQVYGLNMAQFDPPQTATAREHQHGQADDL
jgi:N-methylhydantoinase B